MALTFYPHPDDTQKGSLRERIEILMEAAERYKATIIDLSSQAAAIVTEENGSRKRIAPRDQVAAYNWEEIARVLREVRDMAEVNKVDRSLKSELLNKLAEVYEVLRAARMSKLEAVRLALINEANQLGGGASQVA